MPETSRELSARATAKRIEREKGSPVTTRDWDSYPFIFRLRDKEPGYWKGKSILDVGSGDKWKDPEATFPGAKVCAVDPEFEGRRIAGNTAHEKRQGVVQEIPYDDNSFDLVLSSHAIPQHILPIDMPRAVSEMVRVMKPNGEIRMAPCVRGSGDISPALEKALAENGFKIDFLEGGTDGTITAIKAGEGIKDSVESKDNAWQAFHKQLTKGSR